MTLWIALAFLATAIAGVWFYRWRTTARLDDVAMVPSSAAIASARATIEKGHVAFQSDTTAAIGSAVYATSFSVPHFDYRILGPHLEVLEAAKQAASQSISDQRYFPRKPALLPKLLRALNAGDSSREEIVRLILQDPVLAGNVLKRANSAYYRQGADATESVDRAVVILGNEGLRAPVATAVMQPVFKLPRGFFDRFAPITWELAQRTAVAAEVYALRNKTGDAFVAHLLGLIGGLGRIALFRITLDKYSGHNIMPQAEVFIRVMMDHELQVTRLVAAAWEMSPSFLAAIDAQIERTPPLQMSPLARALYYASLCGGLTVLHHRDRYAVADAHAVLREQGLNDASLEPMWSAAAEVDAG